MHENGRFFIDEAIMIYLRAPTQHSNETVAIMFLPLVAHQGTRITKSSVSILSSFSLQNCMKYSLYYVVNNVIQLLNEKYTCANIIMEQPSLLLCSFCGRPFEINKSY